MKKWFFSKGKKFKEDNIQAIDISNENLPAETPDKNNTANEVPPSEVSDIAANEDSASEASNNNNAMDQIHSSEIPDGGISLNVSEPKEKKKWILIRNKKPWSLKKKIIISSVSVIAAIIIVVGILVALPILHPSLDGFETIAQQLPSPDSVQTEPQVSESAGAPTTATPDAVGEFISKGDFTILQDTVNIMLIGVDYAPERDDWNGKHTYHSDVMIVLSINRKTNQVSLISLPRDTYAQIPADPKGIYKLNASLNCGGVEWPDPKACDEVCQAASWMIGGLPIQYFYAVDMSAVKGLVDKIGGVDFNVDIAFTIDSRSYKEGMQHLDGQGALDYMRVRKEKNMDDKASEDEQGDWNRVNRQKNLLKAIFQKLKDSGGILQIPNIISSFDSSHLVTNVPLEYTYALAGYSLSINPNDIKVYSMSGPTKVGIFGLNYAITDQKNRVNILKEVFGIDITDKAQVAASGIKVPDYSSYDWSSAHSLWLKMQRHVTLDQADKMLGKIKAKLDADAALPTEPTPPPPTTEPPASAAVTSDVTSAAAFEVSGKSMPGKNVSLDSTQYRKYASNGKEWTLYNTCKDEYNQLDSNGATDDLLQNIQDNITKLAGYLSINVSSGYWDVVYNTYFGGVNQPYVHNAIKVDPR